MSSIESKPLVKVVPHDDGLALVFDPEFLREFGIDETTPISVTIDGNKLRISPAGRFATPDEIDAAMKRVNEKWGGVLKKLAE